MFNKEMHSSLMKASLIIGVISYSQLGGREVLRIVDLLFSDMERKGQLPYKYGQRIRIKLFLSVILSQGKDLSHTFHRCRGAENNFGTTLVKVSLGIVVLL